MLRLWRRFVRPYDKFQAMAELVAAVRDESPGWTRIIITRTATGVEFGHD